MNRIGVTGTREGLTEAQFDSFVETELPMYDHNCELHHGDCVGVDAQIAEICKEYGWTIVCHPPKDSRFRAYVDSDIIFPEKEYIARNRDIVDTADIMYAFPKEMEEVVRSGTWATIRYAQKCGVYVIIILPDGNIYA